MESIEDTRTILNEDPCNDKAGEIEFTKEFANRIEFEEWLKVEKNSIKWNRKSGTGPKDKKLSRYGRPAIFEWTENYYCPFSGQKRNYTPVEGVKRRKTGASMKVGCKAMLKASQKLNTETVIVNVSYHTNHIRDSNYTWTKDHSAADNLKVAQQITAMAVNFDTIAPQEKEFFNMVRVHLYAFKSSEKRSETSLTQKQRR